MALRLMLAGGLLGILVWGSSWTTAGRGLSPTPIQVLERGGFGGIPRVELSHASAAVWQLDDAAPPLFGVFSHEATRPQDTAQLRAFDLWMDVPRLPLNTATRERLLLAARLLGQQCLGQEVPLQLERLMSSLPLWAAGQEYRWRGGWSLRVEGVALPGQVRIALRGHLITGMEPTCRMPT